MKTKKLFKMLFCDLLPWHNGKGRPWFDGCSTCSTCSRCGKPVMQDSQGNWFV